METALTGTVVLGIIYEVKKQHLICIKHPFHCDLIAMTKPFVTFYEIWYLSSLQKLLRKLEFCENQFDGSHTFLMGIN
jgi:hypothetical protein